MIDFDQFSKCYSCVFSLPNLCICFCASLNNSLVLFCEYWSIIQSTFLRTLPKCAPPTLSAGRGVESTIKFSKRGRRA